MKSLTSVLKSWRRTASQESEANQAEPERCLHCGVSLRGEVLYERYRVCPGCRHHYSLSARERIALLTDADSFKETSKSLVSVEHSATSEEARYGEQLARAQKRSGLREAAITGTCRIGGQPSVLIALDFGFLGGSMGSVVGEKVARAFELALKQKLPVIALVTSGGDRLQEGIHALMQLAKTVAAAHRHQAAGLPYIAVMGNPTTGGVYASFANLADIIIAEPGALIGYAPLRVVEEITGGDLPPGAHTSEFHFNHGMVDQIVDRADLRDTLATILHLLRQHSRPLELTASAYAPRSASSKDTVSAWQAIQIVRDPQRPTARDYIDLLADRFVGLRGDRCYGDDDAVICGLADIAGQTVVLIGQQRKIDTNPDRTAWIYPEGFRKAQRAMHFAARLRLPLVTLIDTIGAYPGLASEERGIGQAIAECLATMSTLPTQTLAVITGETGGAGALAFAIADRVLMQQNAIYSVASVHDTASASTAAARHKLTAADCRNLKFVDGIVAEPPDGAHTDVVAAAALLKDAILHELEHLQRIPASRLVARRYRRLRQSGVYSTQIKNTLAGEVDHVQQIIHQGAAQLVSHIPFTGRQSEPSPAQANLK